MKLFWKYIFPPLYGLFFYTILRLVSDLTNKDEFWLRSYRQNGAEIVGTILLSYLMTRVPHYFVRRFGRRQSSPPPGAIFLEFGLLLLVALVLGTTASTLVHIAANDYPI